MTNKRVKGSEYERKTCDYLVQNGYTILQTNYFTRFGEIDIIAQKEKVLTFVEVKYRAYNNYGNPVEAIHYYKRRNIINSAKWYIKDYKRMNQPVRFDVAIWYKGKLNYIKEAFNGEGL